MWWSLVTVLGNHVPESKARSGTADANMPLETTGSAVNVDGEFRGLFLDCSSSLIIHSVLNTLSSVALASKNWARKCRTA